MDELEAAWKRFCASRAKVSEENTEDRASAMVQDRLLLVEAYDRAPVPDRERSLVFAGMQSTCCCNGGTTEAEIYCKVAFERPG